MMDFLSDYVVPALLVICIPLAAVMVLVMIYLDIEEAREWRAFKVEHHCAVIGSMKGGSSVAVGTTVTSGGHVGVSVTPVFESDKTGWKCDDGKEYWR
jgi:hypothetical protein